MNKPNTHYGSDYTFKWIVVDGLYFKVSEDLDTNELVLGETEGFHDSTSCKNIMAQQQKELLK